MRILQCALGKQVDQMKALQNYGEVIYWDWSGRHNSFDRDILALAEEHNPDIIWMQIQTPNILKPWTAKTLSEKAICIQWSGDVRDDKGTEWYWEVGKHIALTLFTNMHDVEVGRSRGVNCDYLQVGFPTEIFKPEGEVIDSPPIIFMGQETASFPLSKYRSEMVAHLRRVYGDRFKVYGSGWGGAENITDQHREAAIYRGCKIGINLSHFNYERYSSDRLWRIMGAGAMCLSHNYNGIEKEFVKGVHLDTWDTLDGLTYKIDYYLNSRVERGRIAQQGCKLVHEQHTWNNRMEQLFKMLKK